MFGSSIQLIDTESVPGMPQPLRQRIGAKSDRETTGIALDWLHRLTFEVLRGRTIFMRGNSVYSYRSPILQTALIVSGRVRPDLWHPLDCCPSVRTCLKRTLCIDSDKALERDALCLLDDITEIGLKGFVVFSINESTSDATHLYDPRLPIPALSRAPLQ